MTDPEFKVRDEAHTFTEEQTAEAAAMVAGHEERRLLRDRLADALDHGGSSTETDRLARYAIADAVLPVVEAEVDRSVRAVQGWMAFDLHMSLELPADHSAKVAHQGRRSWGDWWAELLYLVRQFRQRAELAEYDRDSQQRLAIKAGVERNEQRARAEMSLAMLDTASRERDDALKRAEQAERERDLAIAHDRQPYPTAWAYEQACKALEKHRARAERAETLLRDLINPDDCYLDHHGGCQAHGYLSLQPGEKCPHAEAKELLAALDQPEAPDHD